MRHIGDSIIEAIDWTQDRLATTRPLAEGTLFSMLTAKRVRETEQGFVLVEETDEEEMRNTHHTIKHKFGRGKGGSKRGFRHPRKHTPHKRQFTKQLDDTETADDMIEADDANSQEHE